MYRGKSIAVVVPAYNEELLIRSTLEGIPELVDAIVVVDDRSRDHTAKIVSEVSRDDSRVSLVTHAVNRGVGAAIASGYEWCRDRRFDVAVVMAGDGQMDPADLPALLAPVVDGRADYAKGNRLASPEARRVIPPVRYAGIRVLSLLTKLASGYWHLTDSQCGYTAANATVLCSIPLESIYPRYGVPNDLLVTLRIHGFRVVDVPVRPVYGKGEESGIRFPGIIFSLSTLLFRLFAKRIRLTHLRNT